MDVIYSRGHATARQVIAALGGPATDASIRKLLRLTEEKGWLTHEVRGVEHVYSPRVLKERAAKSAIRHLVRTFFDGSTERAAGAVESLARAPRVSGRL